MDTEGDCACAARGTQRERERVRLRASGLLHYRENARLRAWPAEGTTTGKGWLLRTITALAGSFWVGFLWPVNIYA